MNHSMDIFWTCFDSLGGAQWCISGVGNIWSCISDGLALIIDTLVGGCK